MNVIRIGDEVADALSNGGAVVALESTIFSSLGLPPPDNQRVLDDCLAAIRGEGAVPGLCAVIDGTAHVGTTDFSTVLHATRKLGERDLPVAIAEGATGVTTVSATLALAAAAGIEVFATGGIGGVHRSAPSRGAELSGDISADLDAISRRPVITVSAGVKGFLDVPRTVEYLETLGVPVLGWQTDEFPSFWCRTSGQAVSARVERAEDVAHIMHAARAIGNHTGMLLVAPCPDAAAIPAAEIDPVIERALVDADAAGVRGGAVTPFVLDRINAATNGRSLVANHALAVRNAQIAARVARSLRSSSL